MVDDGDLIQAAQAGDRQALDTLLRRHYERVYAICRRMTGNEHDALDATQNALIAITRGLDR
ncbi:MAG: RNA polymerase sigma factor, partial [Acidimicrobiales bacterium]